MAGAQGYDIGPVGHPLPDGGRLRVLDAGLACCALEFSAASLMSRVWQDAWQDAAPPAGAPPAALTAAGPVAELVAEPPAQPDYEVLVVAGTLTTPLIPVVRDLVASLGPRSAVVSFGACSTSGGPYWDSYAVVPGLESLGIDVAVHVPGCPPPPSAVLAAIAQAREAIEARAHAVDAEGVTS